MRKENFNSEEDVIRQLEEQECQAVLQQDIAALGVELLFQIRIRHVKQLRETAQLVLVGVDDFRNRPDRFKAHSVVLSCDCNCSTLRLSMLDRSMRASKRRCSCFLST